MTEHVQSSSWTGLDPDGRAHNVRDAQRPVPGGPRALEAVRWDWRTFNWSIVFQLLFVWLVVAVVTPDWSRREAGLIVAMVIGGWVALSIAFAWVARIRGRNIALVLDERGLFLPLSHAAPIPWSRVGQIDHPLCGRL